MTRPICVIGAGYVGAASMIGLAELNWNVIGFDNAPEGIRRLKAGFAPYHESGVDSLLRSSIESGRLTFADSLEDAVRSSEIIIVAVRVANREDGSADMASLVATMEALRNLGLQNWPTVVIRSAVPPGTCDLLAAYVEGWGELIYAPEFLHEASAVRDFLTPDRIVVGSVSSSAAVPYVSLFEALQKPVFFTTRCNAELIKCGSSAFFALKMSFANEMSNLCDALGASADDVLRGIGYDQRIGSQFLQAGSGYSGKRFAKDVKSIERAADRLNISREIVSAALRVNEAQESRMINLVEDVVGSVDGLEIGVWGLASEPGSGETRDSLALHIIEKLSERGASIIAYDPAVHVAALPRGSRLVGSALEAAKADILLVLTAWPEFQEISPLLYAGSISRRIVIDARNVLESERVACAGLTYCGTGRTVARSDQTLLLASAQ